jgi:lipoyl(octanoyl) transferase
MTRPPFRVLELGRRGYSEVYRLQRELAERRISGIDHEDLLLLVEHDPVVTLGRGTRASSLPIPAESLRARGFQVEESDRGGDVTYHGPGQLVGYPILDLHQHRLDLHWYLRQLEAALINALARLDVAGERNPGRTGVWCGPRKIASIGIHVRQWVTTHGFALNVATDGSGFDAIVPCGIPDVEMTSVGAELERAGEPARSDLWRECTAAVVAGFSEVFERTPAPVATQHA